MSKIDPNDLDRTPRTHPRFEQLLWVDQGNYFMALAQNGTIWRAGLPFPLVWEQVSD